MATIRRRGSSWQVQVRRQGNPALTRSFSSKKAADVWAREQERAADFGGLPCTIPQKKSEPTLGEMLDRYRREITCHKRGVVQEGFLIGVLARHPSSKLPVSAVTPPIVCGYRDQRLQKAKPATVRRELAVLSHCFEIGRKEWGIAVPNPVKEIRLPSPSKSRDRRLTAKEQTALHEAVSESRAWYLKPLVTLAVETGMRRGELLALEWINIDLIQRTATLPVTKNGNKRVVPLTAGAIGVLQTLPVKGKLVFPLKSVAVHQAWNRATKKALIADFRFHDLRHEAISRFFEFGLSVAEVAFISGHKDVRMLFRYTHLKAQNVLQRIDTCTTRHSPG